MASIHVITAKTTHADGVQVGITGEKIGFLGATPVVLPANANQAVCTDAASVIVLANGLRSALVTLGLIKGSA